MKFIKNLIAKPYGSLSARYENGDLVNRVSATSKTVFSLALAPCNMAAKIITCIYFGFMLRKLNLKVWCVIAGVFIFIVLITKAQLKIETKLNTMMQKAYGEKEIITRELKNNQKDALSDGQKQMVNILRGCYKDAEILFADEATSSIDLSRHQKIMEDLVRQCDTIICITHDPKFLSLFDRIIIMENGMIAADDILDKIENTAAYQKWLCGETQKN